MSPKRRTKKGPAQTPKRKVAVDFVGGPMDGQSLEVHGGYSVPGLQLEIDGVKYAYIREFYEAGKAHFVLKEPT